MIQKDNFSGTLLDYLPEKSLLKGNYKKKKGNYVKVI